MSKTYNNSFSDLDAPADVAIVGLGPGGLAAALKAASLGKRVVAFSDRPEYIRGQRMIIKTPTLDFLNDFAEYSNPEDQKFMEKCYREVGVQTKDIERFLYRKLQSYPNVQIVQLEKSDKIQSVSNKGTATAIELSNGQKFHTQNILAADGAHHNFADLMNKNLNANIQYNPSSVQERHEYHAVVQLNLKFEACSLLNASQDPNSLPTEQLKGLLNNKDGCILYSDNLYYFDQKKETTTPISKGMNRYLVDPLKALNKDEGRLASFKELRFINMGTSRFAPSNPEEKKDNTNIARRAMSYIRYGWEKDYEPKSNVIPNLEGTKFYFAGEIPKKIFDAPNETRKDLLQQWASEAIKKEYGYGQEQLEFRTSAKTPIKNDLQASVFEMKMQVAQEPLIKLDNGVFTQVGDARRTPNYNLGHGLNDAVAGGIAFVNAIGSSKEAFKEERFLSTLSAMDKYVENGMTIKLNPEHEKLVEQIDKLIKHLDKRKVLDEPSQKALLYARDDVASAKGVAKLADAIKVIQPIVKQHQHQDMGLAYRAWRCIASLFSEKASNTKSANLLTEVSEKMEKIAGPR